jgi:hypothetical protein
MRIIRSLLPKPMWGRPQGFAPTSVCVSTILADLSQELIAAIVEAELLFIE